jgi:signal recognition particle receptor subunit beta
MVQINFGERQVTAKIVYYGPGMSGKTTNIEVVHQKAPPGNRGELTSISTDGDRTLFFDFMPLDLGTVAGLKTSFQIYTVPGQVYYNSTRKLVLQGVDGVVFVADSSATMVEENLESLRNLEQNLAEYGKDVGEIPLVIQYNKRDLPDALPLEELERLLNPRGVPSFEAVANTGQGVFPTLKALASIVIQSIHSGTRSLRRSLPPSPSSPRRRRRFPPRPFPPRTRASRRRSPCRPRSRWPAWRRASPPRWKPPARPSPARRRDRRWSRRRATKRPRRIRCRRRACDPCRSNWRRPASGPCPSPAPRLPPRARLRRHPPRPPPRRLRAPACSRRVRGPRRRAPPRRRRPCAPATRTSGR